MPATMRATMSDTFSSPPSGGGAAAVDDDGAINSGSGAGMWVALAAAAAESRLGSEAPTALSPVCRVRAGWASSSCALRCWAAQSLRASAASLTISCTHKGTSRQRYVTLLSIEQGSKGDKTVTLPFAGAL